MCDKPREQASFLGSLLICFCWYFLLTDNVPAFDMEKGDSGSWPSPCWWSARSWALTQQLSVLLLHRLGKDKRRTSSQLLLFPPGCQACFKTRLSTTSTVRLVEVITLLYRPVSEQVPFSKSPIVWWQVRMAIRRRCCQIDNSEGPCHEPGPCSSVINHQQLSAYKHPVQSWRSQSPGEVLSLLGWVHLSLPPPFCSCLQPGQTTCSAS